MKSVPVVLLVAVACLLGPASCQMDCDYPTTTAIENAIAEVLRTGEGASSPIEIALMRYQLLCLAPSQEKDRYRGVSVLVEYNCMLHSACPSSQPAVEQFEFGCESGEWTSTVAGATSGQRTTSPSATFTTSLRQDCAFCLSATSAGSVSAPPPEDTLRNCISCDPACDEGLMRCYGNGDSDCCNFYSNSQCVDECPSPFQNNSDSVCVCPVGTTGASCGEAVDCGVLSDPANGRVTVSTTTFTSTATYSCNSGYNLVGVASRTCQASGSWSGTAPECAVVDCGTLEDPANGEVTVSDTIFTSEATYSCSEGYTLEGDVTRTCLASGSWSGSQPSCTSPPIGRGCPEISPADVERVIGSYVAEQVCSGMTNCAPEIILVQMHTNCLSSGLIRGTYSHATVTASYKLTEDGINLLAQADIGCSNATNSWEASVLRSLASSLDRVFAFGSGTEGGETRTACSACLSPELALELGTTSDSIYHCVGCDETCSAAGSGLCYGPLPTDCCSYYSASGACVDDCGVRRTYDSQWQCVCAGGWREPDCSECDLSCENGGTPDLLGCTACRCPAGYTGARCAEDVDECSSSSLACSNGDCTNTEGGYSCSCFHGYTGERCEVGIDECSGGTHDCVNGGVCIDETPGYRCECRDGTSGEKCERCELSGCQTCRTDADKVVCSQCQPGFSLTTDGYCERPCEVRNCLKCTEGATSRCDQCHSGYTLSGEGLCIVRGGATAPTTSDREEDSRDSGSGFEIAAILAAVIIFCILLLTLFTCIIVGVAKKFCCKKSGSEPLEKQEDVKRAMQRRANPAYVQSSYLGAQITFGAEEVETTEMIDTVEDGESEGESEGGGEGEGEGEQDDGESGGEDDTVPLSEV